MARANRPTDPNPKRAQRDWPPVVVAGAYQTGVVLMRNLARRGLKTCCFDWHPEHAGFRTVYGKGFFCPNPDEQPQEWLAFMLDLAKKLGTKPVLISSADQFVVSISQFADELSDAYIFHKPAASVQSLLATKERQYDIANEHGLPVPRTQFIKSLDEITQFASSARFPCLIKPLHCREWEECRPDHPFRYTKIVTAETPEKLIECYHLAAEISPQMVVQEIIEGPDTAKMVYLSCYARDGRRLGGCLVRQLRTTPIYFGSASIVEPVVDPETDALCDNFMRSIGYVGMCELEIKRDSRDGQVKLIEANPRYSVTADAAPYAGIDLGWLHYLDLIGQPVEPVEPHGRNFRHICLTREFATVGSYRRAGLLTWREQMYSYRPPLAFYDFDLRDWRVTGGTMMKIARMMFGPTIRKFIPKKKKPAVAQTSS